ncbi:uncharacterized protein LOC118403070 [Branchiostoma floridae]|uniref:Uncharacterized protein LOC118403070 n=1 Tax=Branchiostoma floridae TaxID=7739 RepID=A0A9J7HCW4_BRAFL|nr:uncharacterized protein LOC118403070 [Branchiostoma floridae]
MWKFLIFIAAVIVWPASAQDHQVYLTTHDNWAFYKILVAGQMTDANVKATCEAAGMRYPCRESGTNGCTVWGWTSDCIAYDSVGNSCYTHWFLSSKLCGIGFPDHCQPLDDTFVYSPGLHDDSALGVDYDTHSWGLYGTGYNNMYALCAGGASI